jgi:hypothetical protein
MNRKESFKEENMPNHPCWLAMGQGCNGKKASCPNPPSIQIGFRFHCGHHVQALTLDKNENR